jgi:hypothetical protein
VNAQIEKKVRRLSVNQLKALLVLASDKNGVATSDLVGDKLGFKGKSLGGLLSSLSRQNVVGKSLIYPLGRSISGRGLRWKLNSEIVSVEELKILISEILMYC